MVWACRLATDQDRTVTDVVQGWGDDRAMTRLFFKRKDDSMVLKVNPALLEVCATSALSVAATRSRRAHQRAHALCCGWGVARVRAAPCP